MADRRSQDLEVRLRAAVLRGEEFAWRALVDRHGDELERRARRYPGGSPEDLVQETWMVALKRMRDFDPQQGALGAWLGGILHGLGRNRGRRANRDAGPMHQEPLSPTPGDGDVERALTGLDPATRRLLDGKYVDGLSVKELAEREGCSAKAMEQRLARAREAFRQVWSKDEERNA